MTLRRQVTLPYPPDLFAATHDGTPGDVAFYRRECAGAGSVLELGCGYGRLLRELTQVADTVVGIDHDDGLLGMAATTAARLSHGDMTDFDLGQQFDRVVLAHSGLYCLGSDDAVLQCFAAARRHLADGGRFLLDGYVADEFHDQPQGQSWPDDEDIELPAIRARGQQWRLFERSGWDREAQRIEVGYRYVGEDGTTVETGLTHHYVLRPQLTELLAAAGFDARVSGGFAGESWSPQALSWACVSGKANGRAGS